MTYSFLIARKVKQNEGVFKNVNALKIGKMPFYDQSRPLMNAKRFYILGHKSINVQEKPGHLRLSKSKS